MTTGTRGMAVVSISRRKMMMLKRIIVSTLHGFKMTRHPGTNAHTVPVIKRAAPLTRSMLLVLVLVLVQMRMRMKMGMTGLGHGGH